MRSGTLAMFDALGFKGIWNRYDVKRDPECVMRKLIASERYALEVVSKDFGSVESAVANPARSELQIQIEVCVAGYEEIWGRSSAGTA